LVASMGSLSSLFRPTIRGLRLPNLIKTQSVQFVICVPGVNFFRSVIRLLSGVIGQRQQRQALAVVEVTVGKSAEKEDKARNHQGEAEKHQNDDHIHDDPRDMRTVVRLTTASELAGMKMAAATGVTRPAAQKPIATRL